MSLIVPHQMIEWGKSLDLDIASGDAAIDTLKTYGAQLKQYFLWCRHHSLDPMMVDEETIKQYRRYLVKKNLRAATIALKLTVVRRLYAAAVERGLMTKNPAAKVKPPRERKDPAERNNYLELEEAQKLVEALPCDNSLVGLRSRLLVVLMLICGCRQIELHRLNVGDIIRRGNKVGIRVNGKGSIRVVPLTKDVASVFERYLKARIAAGEKLTKDTPMFVSNSRNSKGCRLTRRSMQKIVNDYLEAASLKHTENRTMTTHGLRHTVGYLLTSIGKPLRVIQEFLGHSDPRTTAIYAHIVNLWENNPASSLRIVV
jgi:site-specific recombinase XerD